MKEANELREYKVLLIQGVITQKEFNAKKKQILFEQSTAISTPNATPPNYNTVITAKPSTSCNAIPKTAKALYDYCVKNGYGYGMTRTYGIKHFQLVTDMLMPEEEVVLAFIGLHNYKSITQHNDNFAFVVTNNRILMGQKKIFGQISQVIALENINDITLSTAILLGIVEIDTFKERFNVAVGKGVAKKIYSAMHDVFCKHKNQKQHTSFVQNDLSSADEIMKLKQLLEQGVISQSEFDAKKKQLLGL
jgi:hypothetical protein